METINASESDSKTTPIELNQTLPFTQTMRPSHVLLRLLLPLPVRGVQVRCLRVLSLRQGVRGQRGHVQDLRQLPQCGEGERELLRRL